MWEIQKKKYSYKWYCYSTNDRENCEKFGRKNIAINDIATAQMIEGNVRNSEKKKYSYKWYSYSTNDRGKCEKFGRKNIAINDIAIAQMIEGNVINSEEKI